MKCARSSAEQFRPSLKISYAVFFNASSLTFCATSSNLQIFLKFSLSLSIFAWSCRANSIKTLSMKVWFITAPVSILPSGIKPAPAVATMRLFTLKPLRSSVPMSSMWSLARFSTFAVNVSVAASRFLPCHFRPSFEI